MPTDNENKANSTAPQALVDLRSAAQAKLNGLQRRANYGLYVLAGFLLMSFAALDEFSFLPSFTPAFRKTLGAAPTANFISMALVVYLFSAVIMSLARMMSGGGKTGGIAHLGYLGVFYGFYHFSGELADNIWAVLGAGLTILALEAFQLWNYCQDEIRQVKELLVQLDRNVQF
jgi:hypothetical protein